ncbi:MAG: GDP-L-fucose synthase [Hyphomicrobiales bacterium]|nr:GDP-L-fucose synthase [Hyphomicrobiales bacterium]
MSADAKIFVAGHRGLAGSSIVRHLQARGFTNILTRARAGLDLREQAAVRVFFERERPEFVFCGAATVGGIGANSARPAEFIYDNLMIQTNVIDACWRSSVQKLVFLGSTCIYPRLAPQPMREEHLLTGLLEPTNEAYAIAKIAGLKMCEAYARQYGMRSVTVMPTNLYGPGDNFDLEASHVIPALMRKAHEAKLASAPSMTVWGTGAPLREFLHVDDLAEACVFAMERVDKFSMVNAGSGEEIAIANLMRLIADVVGFEGEIVFDASKPDGTPRKLADVSRLHALGWRARTPLRDGLEKTYRWFLANLHGHGRA